MDQPGTGPDDPAAIQAEIEATRERLGRTVDELGARLDVPARARARAHRARDTAVGSVRDNPPAVLGAGLALVVLVGAVIVRRRKRTSARRTR